TGGGAPVRIAIAGLVLAAATVGGWYMFSGGKAPGEPQAAQVVSEPAAATQTEIPTPLNEPTAAASRETAAPAATEPVATPQPAAPEPRATTPAATPASSNPAPAARESVADRLRP